MRIDQRDVRKEKAAFNGGPHTSPRFLLSVFSAHFRSLLIPLRAESESRGLRARRPVQSLFMSLKPPCVYLVQPSNVHKK